MAHWFDSRSQLRHLVRTWVGGFAVSAIALGVARQAAADPIGKQSGATSRLRGALGADILHPRKQSANPRLYLRTIDTLARSTHSRH